MALSLPGAPSLVRDFQLFVPPSRGFLAAFVPLVLSLLCLYALNPSDYLDHFLVESSLLQIFGHRSECEALELYSAARKSSIGNRDLEPVDLRGGRSVECGSSELEVYG